jgi:hypothetical protein
LGVFGGIRYLSSGQEYFGKIVGRVRKNIKWQKWMSIAFELAFLRPNPFMPAN